MKKARWIARVRPDRRGYPLLNRDVWYSVSSSDELGCTVKVWGKEVFIFAQDAEMTIQSDHNVEGYARPEGRAAGRMRRRLERV